MNKILEVFFYGLTIDLAYAWYIVAVNNAQKFKAGLLSVMIALPAVFGVIEIYDERLLAVPYCLGLFCGTVLALFFASRNLPG